MPKAGSFLDALVDISEDDDLSVEVDLGASFEKLLVLVPTITSSTVGVQVAEKSGGTYYPLYRLDDDATGDFLDASTAGTTSKALVFNIGGAQFIKVSCGSAQAEDRTFRVRGIGVV